MTRHLSPYAFLKSSIHILQFASRTGLSSIENSCEQRYLQTEVNLPGHHVYYGSTSIRFRNVIFVIELIDRKHEQKLIRLSLYDFKEKLEKGLILKILNYWSSQAGYTVPEISKAT